MNKVSIKKRELKIYDEWNKDRYDNRKDKDNIFPIGISDRQFVDIITNIFLGRDWYTPNPISRDQINEEILEEIIFKFTGKTSNERCK
jgi:hypothetical protein